MTDPNTTSRVVHRVGLSALLVDCRDLDDVLGLHARLAQDPQPGQIELIPAASTLLIRYAGQLSADALRARSTELSRLEGIRPQAGKRREIEIPVTYDGDDLTEVAKILDCPVEEIIARHSGVRWVAAFAGFSPGFAYLVQDSDAAPALTTPTPLTVPRRDAPRTKVPAGSVALAGDFSAVYPSDSPGGWQLIGRTSTRIWDVGRKEPALLIPGTSVRFTPVRDSVELQDFDDAGRWSSEDASARKSPGMGNLAAASGTVVKESDTGSRTSPRLSPPLIVGTPGLSTLVQDAGRPGHTGWGVSPSGWADPWAADAANALVGNSPNAALLEHTAGGLQLTAREDIVLAAVGAQCPLSISGPTASGAQTVTGNGESGSSETQADTGTHASAGAGSSRRGGTSTRSRPAPMNRPFALLAGHTLTVGPARRGLRLYLAVRGGILRDPVLGSVATDTISRLGPPPMIRGEQVRVGTMVRGAVLPEMPPVSLPGYDAGTRLSTTTASSATSGPGTITDLTAIPGPREGWFTEESLACLDRAVWEVSPESNRVGVRLIPVPSDRPDAPREPLVRRPSFRGKELPSEGVVAGAIQIPPNGHPVVFLADHPVTGGYPVIGVVTPESKRLLAQAPPGTRVRIRFSPVLLPGSDPVSNSAPNPTYNPVPGPTPRSTTASTHPSTSPTIEGNPCAQS